MPEFHIDEALDQVPFEELHKRALKAIEERLDTFIVGSYKADRVAQARMYDFSARAAMALWNGASFVSVHLPYLTATADGPYHLRVEIKQEDIH